MDFYQIFQSSKCTKSYLQNQIMIVHYILDF